MFIRSFTIMVQLLFIMLFSLFCAHSNLHSMDLTMLVNRDVFYDRKGNEIPYHAMPTLTGILVDRIQNRTSSDLYAWSNEFYADEERTDSSPRHLIMAGWDSDEPIALAKMATGTSVVNLFTLHTGHNNTQVSCDESEPTSIRITDDFLYQPIRYDLRRTVRDAVDAGEFQPNQEFELGLGLEITEPITPLNNQANLIRRHIVRVIGSRIRVKDEECWIQE